jgi:crotonobetainyl-CoA:carnitine CoA-transferase CaiB-like acyl-CoA transferase
VIRREDLIPLQWESQTVQEKIKEELSLLFREKTMVEWQELLDGQEICFSPVLNIEETLDFPHLQRRGMFQGIEGEGGKTIPQVGFPIKLSNTPAAYFIPPPKMGQDNRSVLQKAGFSMEEIQLLEKEGIIGTAPSSEKQNS